MDSSWFKLLFITFQLIFTLVCASTLSLEPSGKIGQTYYCPGNESRPNVSIEMENIELFGFLFPYELGYPDLLLMSGAITYSVESVNR